MDEESKSFRLPKNEEGYRMAAKVLWALNRFLYISTNETKRGYISKYHEFWEEEHEGILKIEINEDKCFQFAAKLEHIFATYGRLRPRIDERLALTPKLIANARLFTAVQDFKIRFRQSPYSIASNRPELFQASSILEKPGIVDELLRELGADSQYDKRRKFARLCAQLLVEKYDGEAYNIPKLHSGDAVKVREALVDNPDERFKGSLGFSEKKANMFIRDMYELGIWSTLTNLENLDVSSDANTMRVALRSGIVKTRIPLLTSYLDVYCYQYDAVDVAVSKAWRKVWEVWGKLPDHHRVDAPAFFDFLIYRIGQICCKPNTRACEMPCSGVKLQRLRELISDSNGTCPFIDICGESTKRLNPPRSISKYGATSWTSGVTNEGGGGGISS